MTTTKKRAYQIVASPLELHAAEAALCALGEQGWYVISTVATHHSTGGSTFAHVIWTLERIVDDALPK